MKKTTYSVTVYWMVNGAVASVPAPLTGTDAENVANLAREHKDLRFTYSGADTLVPWESVIKVEIEKTVSDVDAPTDTICGGADDNALVVTLGDPTRRPISGTAPNCAIEADPFYDASTITVTLNGETVDSNDFTENATYTIVGGTENDGKWFIPVACDAPANTPVPYTAVFTYQGHTARANGTVIVGGGFG